MTPEVSTPNAAAAGKACKIPLARAEAIHAKLLEALEKTSGSMISSAIGVAAGTIANVKDPEQWHLLSIPMWNKFASYFRVDTEWQILGTPNLTAIWKVCETAQQQSRMLSLVAETGMGKSTGLRHYHAENRGNVFYVHMEKTMSKRDVLRTILKATGVEEDGSAHQLVVRIAERLREFEKPLLILDDAGKNIDRIVETLQIIYDRTEYYCGIVLAGVPELESKLLSMRRRGVRGGSEFFSRIGNKKQMRCLSAPSAKVIKGFCEALGFTEATAISWIQEHSTDYRELRQNLMNAKHLALTLDKPFEKVTRADMEEML